VISSPVSLEKVRLKESNHRCQAVEYPPYAYRLHYDRFES
jgi:hypothetical protein